ncbi:MAG TPA: TIGR01244 family sulfur transferase [Stellaceae bacterium]|nr:TIGR01244 family sulfur transferase [Stellaceae bacterium]
MKTTVVDQDYAVASQVTAADIADLAGEGVRTLINNRPDGEEPGQLSSSEAREKAAKLGMTYLYIPVQTPTISAADIEATAQALKTAPRPIVAHCRSGTRCYLLWAAVQALAGKDPAQLVMRAAGDGYDIRALPDLLRRIGRA